jgi:tetratricopeptide (TPR) repeat protein
MRGRKPAAVGWLDEAAKALSQSVLLDAGLVRDPETAAHPTPRGLEARLRLAGSLSSRAGLRRRGAASKKSIGRATTGSVYLARLLLGRLADRQGQLDDAIAWYRRALEAWPESQAAALALAHATERSSGPTAARPLVAEAVAAAFAHRHVGRSLALVSLRSPWSRRGHPRPRFGMKALGQ